MYPKMTESRMVFDLNGIWDFALLKEGEKALVQPGKLLNHPMAMPVPSSYNEIYTGREFADHVGDLVYQRRVTVSPQMKKGRLFLRFGSVTHKAQVYLNGVLLGSHQGGFLPFELEITETAVVGDNLLTVFVNNIVDESTLPAGRLNRCTYPGLPEELHNLPSFDFYNYSGIMRPVVMVATPLSYIKKISVFGKTDGSFSWEIKGCGEGTIQVQLLDPEGNTVFRGTGEKGAGLICQPRLWEPDFPSLYCLNVTFTDSLGQADCYGETFGFREVAIKDCRLYLNGKPLYLKGFGKHEDTPVAGRGYNPVYNVKDIGLLKWMGANSFRTSHYPYSEEMLKLCDREGILVIDEAPAVGLHTGFSATGMLGGDPAGTWQKLKTMEHHRDVLRDMVERDENHPCVILWSVANEPASEEEGAREYFEPLVALVKESDRQKRPVTIVTYEGSSPTTCKVAELCDLLILNRYRGWYDTEGNLPAAGALLKEELEGFHRRCPDKPIMLGEYGADTIAGFHDINGRIFSEEYQVEFLKTYGEVFDSLPYITGEHIWNFADFATAENIKRVGGNKKGVFTRDRNPKMAAHFIRRRWLEFEK